MGKIEIVNEDGTPCNPPQNPLIEKWGRLYPSIPKPELSQVCDGYSCGWCDRCPSGSLWAVPEEDLPVWKEYQQELDEYNRIHNPSLYALRQSERGEDA